MIELKGIVKYFPSNGVTALENAGLTLKSGEIHALLGENGTGKSTLMHILAGYFPPTAGTILIDGIKRHFSSPANALSLGIGMVRQHPGFIQGFKVWEDCILGAEKQNLHDAARKKKQPASFFQKCGSLFLDSGASRKRVEDLSNRWGFDLPLDSDAGSLTVSQRQKAAVLSLLLRNVKWFIFDEPTAVLTPGETNTIFELFRRLGNEGRGIILITHKLEEALSISDRVTIIRRGVTGESRNTTDLSIDDLKNAIFSIDILKKPIPGNEEEDSRFPGQQTTEAASHEEKPVLVIKDLLLESPGMPPIRNINLRLMSGRILGIAGVRDSGLETLELAVTGFLAPTRIEGAITLNGHYISGRGIKGFRDAGGTYLGADRLGSNLAPELPLSESLIIHAFRRARQGFGIFLNMGRLNSWCGKIMSRSGIDRPYSDRASSFSGGMLQRILLAREFAEEASLVVLAEAGSGLDEANKARLAEELKAIAQSGAAVLLFSTDIEELSSLADEIMILRNGTLYAANKPDGGNHEI